MNQRGELDQGATTCVKVGARVRQGRCLSPLLFTVYCEYLTVETLESFRDFTMEGQVKYADGYWQVKGYVTGRD